MSPDLIHALTELANALNSNYTALVCIICLIFAPLAIHIFEVWLEHQNINKIEKALTSQIEQLAQDNHYYRDVFLLKLGIDKETLAQISASNINRKV